MPATFLQWVAGAESAMRQCVVGACLMQTDGSSFADDVTSVVRSSSTVATWLDGGRGWGLAAGLLAVPAAVLAGSAMTAAAIGLDRRLHQMSYYFFVSLAVQHALMSITVMLPGVHVLQTGTTAV